MTDTVPETISEVIFRTLADVYACLPVGRICRHNNVKTMHKTVDDAVTKLYSGYLRSTGLVEPWAESICMMAIKAGVTPIQNHASLKRKMPFMFL